VRILVVNDDGPAEPGVWTLAEALRAVGEVRIYTPDRNYSGAGMSIPLIDSYAIRPSSPPAGFDGALPAFTINATPAIVAAIACLHGYGGHPDLVVSGINAGWNPGAQPYVVSGTAGAARAAVDRGIPAIAVSAPHDRRDLNERIGRGVARLARALAARRGLGQDVLLSVNVPAAFNAQSPAWLTTPARLTVFESLRIEAAAPDGDGTAIRVVLGDTFDGPIVPGDETDALRAGAVSVCVTRPHEGTVLSGQPWVSIAAAFAGQ